MKLVDSTIRLVLPSLGVGVRWLKEELSTQGVSVRITDACLREIAADAEEAAKARTTGNQAGAYVPVLKSEIARRVEFLRAWTQSDDPVNFTGIDLEGPLAERLTRIARKYALPRAWRLSDPVAAPSRRPTPTYLYWASAS